MRRKLMDLSLFGGVAALVLAFPVQAASDARRYLKRE